jgi:hypothetical protein
MGCLPQKPAGSKYTVKMELFLATLGTLCSQIKPFELYLKEIGMGAPEKSMFFFNPKVGIQPPTS